MHSYTHWGLETVPPPRFFSADEFDRPLAESQHFVCVATLGSIVPGWILISPRRSVLNFTLLNAEERHDLEQMLDRVTWAVERRFGSPVAFEHGPAVGGSATGCGVDQAHLHVVPIEASAFRQVVEPLQQWLPRLVRSPHELPSPSVDYLWYREADRASSIAFPAQPESQFFRRAVAVAAGAPEAWDYRAHPYLLNIRATQDSLSGLLSEPRRRYG